MKASEVWQTQKNAFHIYVKYIIHNFSYNMDLHYVTLEMKSTVSDQTIADRWLYRMSQDERSILWEVIISVILSKKVYMYTCPIPNGFRDRAISLYSMLYTVQTSNTSCPHTSCKVHWCWRWNFSKCIILGKLYRLYNLNNKYRYYRQNVISFLSTTLELYSEIALSRKQFGIGHMYIYTFCLEWPILWPPRILTFLPGTFYILMVYEV
jgi:hypothetical protein